MRSFDRRFFWKGIVWMEKSMTEGKPNMMRALLVPRWIITTLLVIAAVGVMARLGFWQLDRLQQRRVFNAAVQAQIDAPRLSLNGELQYGNLSGADLLPMEYRSVIVTGTFDPQNEIVLRNQVYQNMPGYHMLTPLRITGTNKAVLIDRGFIGMDESDPAARAKYARSGEVTVSGLIRQGHVPQIFGVRDPELVPGQTRLDAWNAVNIERIQQQVPYELLPVYVEAEPDPAVQNGPIAAVEYPEISEGPHLGYAVQWFSFAGILAFGYPFFVRKQLFPAPRKAKRKPA